MAYLGTPSARLWHQGPPKVLRIGRLAREPFGSFRWLVCDPAVFRSCILALPDDVRCAGADRAITILQSPPGAAAALGLLPTWPAVKWRRTGSPAGSSAGPGRGGGHLGVVVRGWGPGRPTRNSWSL